MIANNANVRQRFKDGIFWIELGEVGSYGALIERLARVVKRSGGETISQCIIRQTDAGKFELAKEEFHNRFDHRAVLCICEGGWPKKRPSN
jgi:hypothetical protein